MLIFFNSVENWVVHLYVVTRNRLRHEERVKKAIVASEKREYRAIHFDSMWLKSHIHSSTYDTMIQQDSDLVTVKMSEGMNISKTVKNILL